MADNFIANPGAGGDTFAADDVSGIKYPVSKLDFGADGASSPVTAANPFPVELTDGANPVVIKPLSTVPVAADNALMTQAIIHGRTTAGGGSFVDVKVNPSGSISADVSGSTGVGVTGPLTDAQLRATAVPISSEASYAEDTPHVSGAIGNLMLAIRSDGDAATADNGDYTVLKLDEEGRLKVASKPASYAATVGNVTSATSTIFVNTERFSNLMIHCAGTFAGANCTFEGSLNSTNGVDGNWFAVQAIRSNANTIETTTGVLAAAPAYAWELSVNALKYFRIRATAWTSGTQVWTMIPGTYATEPIPGAQISGTQPVSGTVTATVTGGTVVGVTPTTTNAILSSAATTNGTVAKATAGTIYGVTASNTGAAVAFVKLYNSATVTVGTTVVALTVPVPAGGVVSVNWGTQGMRYSTGICYSITNLAADTDTTAVALNQVKVNLSYI